MSLSGQGTNELVVARLSVLAQLAVGFQRATLVFTDRRIIVASLDKRSGSELLGRLGKVLVGAFKSSGQKRKTEKLIVSSPDEILASDASNFEIGYNEILRLDVMTDDAGFKTDLLLLTLNEKLTFQLVSARPPEGFEDEMMRILGNRFTLSKKQSMVHRGISDPRQRKHA